VISFLIGSGFSIPYGLPTVGDINKKLSNLTADDIWHGSALNSGWLNGSIDPNNWLYKTPRVVFEHLIEFYKKHIQVDFHYEDFYYFLNQSKIYEPYVESLKEMFASTKGQNSFVDELIDEFEIEDYIRNSRRILSQLVSELLFKSELQQDISTSATQPEYNTFFRLVKQLLLTQRVKIHTLNHDLLLDHYFSKHSGFSQEYSDGFRTSGSPYFAIVYTDIGLGDEIIKKKYTTRVPFFDNSFNTKLTLYKLHGSINYERVIEPNSNSKPIRLKRDLLFERYFKEVYNEQVKEYHKVELAEGTESDYLSGTTSKLFNYNSDPFYKNLFEHFKKNLAASEYLILIGYGFKDSGVNQYLVEYYLNRGKPMMVIDPCQSYKNLEAKFWGQVDFIPKSVSDLTKADLAKYNFNL
jgi:hypothetical protein